MANKSVSAQLKEQGLRLAGSDESGWYTIVLNRDGEAMKVWATDLPKRAVQS